VTLFSFEGPDGDDSTAGDIAKRTFFSKCKTYPGDFLWPSRSLWKLFNVLLGGALIETVPEIAACYDDFGVYNKTKCDFLTNNWTNGSLYQSVLLDIISNQVS
jgi:hypothetical protein